MSRHFLNIPAVYRLGTRWIGSIPKPLAYALSQGIALMSFLFYRKAVHNVRANLRLVFPGMRSSELSRLTLRLFGNYSKYLVDYGRFTHLGRDAVINTLMDFDGRENLANARAMGKGIILLTAHLGNWELGGIFFGSLGLKTNVVTLEDPDPEIDAVRREYRERHNVSTITVGKSPFSTIDLFTALHKGEVIAMLIDRVQPGLEWLEEDFFGRATRIPRGPLILGRLTGAPIVVAFVVRDGAGYKGIVGAPFVVHDENHEREVLRGIVKQLESHIVKYPDQWYNFTPI